MKARSESNYPPTRGCTPDRQNFSARCGGRARSGISPTGRKGGGLPLDRGTLARKHEGFSDDRAAPRVRRVFLAEDNSDIRNLLTRALELDGYEVVGFPDGTALVDYLGDALRPHSDTAVPDIIVSDIRMPGFSGMDVLAALRRAEVEVPVILITGFGDDEMDAEARRLGAVGFINKPFDVDDLRTALRYYIEHGPSHGDHGRDPAEPRRHARRTPTGFKH